MRFISIFLNRVLKFLPTFVEYLVARGDDIDQREPLEYMEAV